MVFNVEPAIYFEGYGGMRHCDMVAVTRSGAEVLTPFQNCVSDLAIVVDDMRRIRWKIQIKEKWLWSPAHPREWDAPWWQSSRVKERISG